MNIDSDLLYRSLQQKLQRAKQNIGHTELETIVAYLQLLHKWNKAYNLTAVRDPQEMVTRHILDSLSIASYLKGTRILDVGSGAGLPGIPLAITHPQLEFSLIDSNNKKIAFLNHLVLNLKIMNVKVIHARVEDYKPHHCFDSIVTRAFSSLANFTAVTQHLLCPDGCWLAMKGEYPEQEIGELDGEFSSMVYDLLVPGLDAARHLVIMARKG